MADRQDEVAIKVSNVSKSFKLPHEKHTSVKGALIGLFNSNRSYEKQQVLKDISFEIKKGEFFGVVGRNGSGKSTLLKLLAGIYTPDKGEIEINGKLTPFIELGVGFSPELTGRENVFLNGALLGFSRKEMEEMYDEIVDFAELEKFMDQKLKNYSSGMLVRLAFSIAIRARTEILLLDEVLAVGDANFQRKCQNYFKKLKNDDCTVIFISHDSGAVVEYCDRAMVVNDGSILYYGNSNKAVALYNDLNFEHNNKKEEKKNERYGDGFVLVEDVTLCNTNGQETRLLSPSEKCQIRLEIKSKKQIDNPLIGIQIRDAADNIVIGINTHLSGMKFTTPKKGKIIVEVDFDNILHNGTYFISTAIKSSDKHILHDQIIDALSFEVAGWQISNGMTHPSVKMSIKERQ